MTTPTSEAHLAHRSVFLQFDGLGQVVANDQRALFVQRL
jgi:hypothetical protein